MEQILDKSKVHPCFNKEAKLKYARVHLPVAPKCNVQCNYCNRKYDCVNESRPGVTSSVLQPVQAKEYLKTISERITNISTIGIAGPGDAFAEPEKTLETIRLIKAEFPDKIFCLSSNGMNIVPYVEEIAALDVTHVTLTINSFRAETLQHVYAWVRHKKKVYRGLAAGEVVLQQQTEALKLLVAAGITVKINTIIMPGINDNEMAEIAKIASELGAATMNCIPLIPVEGTGMADFPKPSRQAVSQITKDISEYIKPMTHCARCRSDAAGMLGKDDCEAYKLIAQCASAPIPKEKKKPYVAVASYEGADDKQTFRGSGFFPDI